MTTRMQVPGIAPSAAPMPYQSTAAPALAFGGGGAGLAKAGQGLMAASSALAEAAARDQALADQQAIDAATNGDREWYRQQRAATDGFFSRQGMDAWNGKDDYAAEVKARVEATAQGLATERQRRAYRQKAADWSAMALDRAYDHAAAQREKAYDSTSAAALANAVQDGASSWNRPNDLDRIHTEGRFEILKLADRKGWGTDEIEAQTRKYDADFFGSVIKQAVADNPMHGAALLEKYRGRLGASYPEVAQAVDHKTKLFRVDQAVAAARAAVPGGQPAGGSPSRADVFAAQRQAIIDNSTLKPDVREAALARLEHDHAQDVAIEAARGREAREAVQNLVLGKSVSPEAIPPEAQALVGPAFMAQMRSAYAKGGKIETDWKVYERLSRMSADELRAVDFSAVRPSLSDDDFKHFAGKLDKAKNAPGDVDTLNRQMSAMFNGLGLTEPVDAEDRGWLARKATLMLDAETRRIGRDLSFDERQKVVDRLAMGVAEERKFWANRMLRDVKTIDDVPEDHVTAIREVMPKATDQDVVDAFYRGVATGRIKAGAK